MKGSNLYAFQATAAILAALALIGCGQNTSGKQSPKKQNGNVFLGQGTTGGGFNVDTTGGSTGGTTDGSTGGTSGTTTGTTGGTTGSTTAGNLPPAYEMHVELLGYDQTSDASYVIEVQANKTLIVQFEPGMADKPVNGTGFTPQYSQLAVSFAVEGQDHFTPLLRNGFYGGEQQVHRMDLSGAFTRTCPASQPTCRQTVRVVVRKPNSDYFCLNYGQYCPYRRNYFSHWVNGVVRVQTDDTAPIP